MRKKSIKKNIKGFTLIELLVVIAVVGLLATGVLVVLDIGGIFGKADTAKGKRFSQSLESGLIVDQVGKWSFEDGAGSTTFKDSFRFKNDGTCTSCPSVQDEDTCGLGFGGCVELDGTNDFIDLGNSSSLNITKEITIAGWFYLAIDPDTDASNNYRNMVGKGYDPYGLSLEQDRKITGSVFIGGIRQKTDTDYLLFIGEWHHVAYTYKGDTGEAKIYVDGEEKMRGSRATGIFTSSTSNAYIGKIQNTYGWPGMIDEVTIYSKSLKTSQIQKIYAEGFIRRAIALR